MVLTVGEIAQRLFIVLTILLTASPSIAAGLCCQFASGVQESLAGGAAPAAEEVSLQFTYSFTRMDQLQQGTSSRSLDEASTSTRYTALPVSMDMSKYTLTAGYGFSPRFKGFISIPYLRNTMDMTMSNGVGLGWMDMPMAPVAALGDVTVMGLYRIYADREAQPHKTLSAGLGIKTATGSATETTASGKYVHAHMQPGTGSWDPLVSLHYTQMVNPVLIQADVIQQFASRNQQGYEFGNATAINLGATYGVVPACNLTAGITFLHVGKASDHDGNYTNLSSLMDDPANTGGDSLWLAPGIQMLPVRNAVVDMKVQLPLWEYVHGIQLVSSFRLVIDMAYRF